MPDGMTMMVPGQTRADDHYGSAQLAWKDTRRPRSSPQADREERDRSVADFVTDHYGREVLDYIAEPMLAGVYGGDPAEIDIGAVMPMFLKWEAKYGSLTQRARAEVKGSKGWLSSTQFGAASGRWSTNLWNVFSRTSSTARVDRVEKGWRVRVNGDWLDADNLVVACRAANVLPDLFPALPYNSAAVIAIGYRKADIANPLPGLRVPCSEIGAEERLGVYVGQQ